MRGRACVRSELRRGRLPWRWYVTAAMVPFAVGANRVDRTPQVAAQLADATPQNVVVLLLDGFDHQLMTAARDYELGADGRSTMDGAAVLGQRHHARPAARSRPGLRHQLRQRLRRDGDRVGDGPEDDRGPDQPGAEHEPERSGHRPAVP